MSVMNVCLFYWSFVDFVAPVCLPLNTDVSKNYTKIRMMQIGWGINNNKVFSPEKTKNIVSLVVVSLDGSKSFLFR